MLVQKTWESGKVGIGRDAEGLAQLRFFKVKVTRIQRIENLLLFEHYGQYQQRLLHEAAEGETSIIAIYACLTIFSCVCACVCLRAYVRACVYPLQYLMILMSIFASASMFPILATTPNLNSGGSKIEALLPTTWKMERLLPEVNEGYFFHGTKPEVVDNVICQGLDIRMAGPYLLGRALYLAGSSTKADQYTGFTIVKQYY